jgi:hypothetical protein
MFLPKSGHAKVCEGCCHLVCLACKKPFFSRKAAFRNVRFCSSACFGRAATGQPRGGVKELPSAVLASGQTANA